MATETRTLKIAMPRQEDINALRDYLNEIEELADDRDMEEEERDEKLLEVAKAYPYRWSHILFSLDVLLDNCVDKTQKTLEFAPWIDKQGEVLKGIDSYLDSNPLNYIGCRSKLHLDVKTALKMAEDHTNNQ